MMRSKIYMPKYQIIYEDWRLLAILPGFYMLDKKWNYLPCTINMHILPNKFSIFGFLTILASQSDRVLEREQFIDLIPETEIKYKIRINDIQNIYCKDLFNADFLKSIDLPMYKKHIIVTKLGIIFLYKVQLKKQTFEDNELVGLIVKGEKV